MYHHISSYIIMYHHISISWGIPMRIQLVCPESREALNGHGAKGSAERSKSTASGCSVGPMARSGSYLMMRLKALSETHGTQAVARTTSTATICIILRLCMELHVMLVWAWLSLENKLVSVFQAASTSKNVGMDQNPAIPWFHIKIIVYGSASLGKSYVLSRKAQHQVWPGWSITATARSSMFVICSRPSKLKIKQISKPDTLWLFNIAMENGPFIDGLPIKNGDFPWLC